MLALRRGDRIAAVEPLAEREHRSRRRDLRPARQRLGAEHRPQHLQHGQVEAGVAREQPRPGAARQHGGVAADAPALGDDAHKSSIVHIDAAHGAVGENPGAAVPCRFRNGRRRLRRLGAAVGGGVQAGDEAVPGAGHRRVERRAAQQAGLHLVRFGLAKPRLLRRDLALVLAEIEDAGLAEAGLAARALVHAAPETQAFERQGDFADVAAHGAAPAPVAAGLLAADAALFAQHDGEALLRQEQGRGHADDAAADDDDAGALGQVGVGVDGIDGRGHAMFRERAERVAYRGSRVLATGEWALALPPSFGRRYAPFRPSARGGISSMDTRATTSGISTDRRDGAAWGAGHGVARGS